LAKKKKVKEAKPPVEVIFYRKTKLMQYKNITIMKRYLKAEVAGTIFDALPKKLAKGKEYTVEIRMPFTNAKNSYTVVVA